MKSIPYLFVFILGLFLASCEETAEKEILKSNSMTDPHSFAQPEKVKTVHLDMNLDISFETKTISGSVVYDIVNATNGDAQLILDSKGLEIDGVELWNGEGFVPGKIIDAETDPVLGTPVIIPVVAETKRVKVTYHTHPGAAALQFLDPQQTAGKTHPFLFTQSQAILARTWIPIQDGPGIRFTYAAEVKVPKGLMAVMSAENPTEVNPDGIYTFAMTQPIPAYLMALAVGNLEFRSIGDRTGVYAEPSEIEASAFEFEDMQTMLERAEGLYGKYRWDRYDVIVLPPSFPFGGMENPRLTFATPTILAGDKSLTALIAHELAHSWSGNLVTNANWNDIWLNEGFTVYFEQRIMEELYGDSLANMLKLLTYQDLHKEIKRLNEEGKSADTRLAVDLEGRDPDDGLTGIPYDKGSLFLTHIESKVGRPTFDEFLNKYFNENAFKTMNTEGFIKYLDENLIKGNQELANEINADEWIFGKDLPAAHPVPNSDRLAKVDAAIATFIADGDVSKLKTDKWVSQEWQRFLRGLPKDIGVDKMTKLDNAFDLSENGNNEELCLWLVLTIHNDYKKALPMLEDFLITIGRRKFLSPLYGALIEAGKLTYAQKIFEAAAPNYHAVSLNSIKAMIEAAKKEEKQA